MSWKEKLVPLLGATSGLAQGYKKNSRIVTILAYHRILPSTEGFSFDEGVISSSPKVFDFQMAFIKENFNVISFNDLKNILKGDNRGNQKPYLIVTFDDGYIDNYTYAYPILKKYGLGATIFLTGNYIGTNYIFWWDQIAYAVKMAERKKVDFKVNGVEWCYVWKTPEDARRTVGDILKKLKFADDSTRKNIVEKIINDLGVEKNFQSIERQTLNWQEVVQMNQNGMEFGAHTMSHPVLANVKDEKQLDYEIAQSKKVIENHLNRNVIVFAYPVGRTHAINDTVIECVKRAGYDFAVSYMHGLNRLDDAQDYFYLKRLDIDGYPLDKFKAKVNWPMVFQR